MEQNIEDTVIFYYDWLQLSDYEFKIIVLIRMLSDNGKIFKGTIEDIEKWLYIKTPTEINKAIKSLVNKKYISFTKKNKIYTLTINDEYMMKKANREVERAKNYYEQIDKYIDIDKYREKLIITRATKENINRIRKFNKAGGTPPAKWWNVIKLYIYALGCEEKETEVISYELLKDLLNTTKGGVKNSSEQLRKIELYKQLYTTREVKHKNENGEWRSWGLIHHIIDTAF